MAGVFDVDLIPKILSVDKKVRLSEIDKRRERHGQNSKGNRPRRIGTEVRNEEDSEKQGTINITV